MEKQRRRLAGTLRWLGGLWLVVWALYVTFRDDGLTASTEGMMIALAALLIPVVVAYAISWALDRYPALDRQK